MKIKNVMAAALMLTAALAIFAVASSPAQAVGPVCWIDTTPYDSFGDALDDVQDGETIKLMENIDYYGRIEIIGMEVTIDLNGFVLNVIASGETCATVYVEDGGLYLEDPANGQLNVDSGDFYGVFANNGSVFVSSIHGYYGLGAIWIENAGFVYVGGDVNVDEDHGMWGANVSGGGLVIIEGVLSAPGNNMFISVGSEYRGPGDFEPGTILDGYLMYEGGSDVVLIKDPRIMVCEIGGVKYETVNKAMLDAVHGDTIKLLADCTYEGMMTIDSMVITFELNGYAITVNGPEGVSGPALLVNDGQLILDDSAGGEFNVISFDLFGVKVSNGTATVTNVTVTCWFAALYVDEGSDLTVKGDVIICLDRAQDSFSVAWVYGDSTVTIDGDVIGLDDSPKYIILGHLETELLRTKEYFVKSTKPGYVTYSNIGGTNTAWLRDNGPYACEIVGVRGYSYLKEALMDAGGHDVIKLFRNIDLTVPLTVDGYDLTMDLNGFILNVTVSGVSPSSPTEAAVCVTNGTLSLTDSSQFGGGVLNVICNVNVKFGVKVENGEATVTSVTSYCGFAALYVKEDGGLIKVSGNVTASGTSSDFSLAWVFGTGIVIVDGVTDVPDGAKFICIGPVLKRMADTSASDRPGYHKYERDTGAVFLKMAGVTDIIDAPDTVILGTPLTLTATVLPLNGYGWFIEWTVDDPGTTGATITNGRLSVTGAGTLTVKATLVTASGNLERTFQITVFVPVTGIEDVPDVIILGTDMELTGTVVPSNSDNRTIVWSVKDDGGTGASIDSSGNLSVTASGIVTVTATVANGLTPTSDYTEDFEITVFVPVTGITGVPGSVAAGDELQLTGTVVPSDADNRTIIWSISDGVSTGATLVGNTLTAAYPGTVVVTATIANGLAPGSDYTEDFSITVETVRVTSITGVPATMSVLDALTLTGTVGPVKATFNTIVWSTKDDGGTGATLDGNVLRAQTAGTVTVTATIVNGLGIGADHVQDFEITVTAADEGTDTETDEGVHTLGGPDKLLIAAVVFAIIFITGCVGLFISRKW